MSGELDFIGDFFGAIFGGSSRDTIQDNRSEYRDDQARRRNRELQNSLNTQKNYVDSLSKNMKNMERNHFTKINDMKSEFNIKLKKQEKEQSIEIKNVRLDLKKDISDLSNQFNKVTNELQGQLVELQDKEIKSADLADRWSDDTSKLLDYINNNYRHEKFMPGQLNQLIQKLNTGVVANINNGVYQSAISNAQNVFLDAQQLRTEIEIKELEWENLYEDIEIDVLGYIDYCENSKKVEFEFSTSQGKQKTQIDVEHWSKGELSEILKKLNVYKNNLSESKDSLSLDDLEELKSRIHEYEDKIKSCINKARNAVFASQVRGDIATELVSKFEKKGWKLKEAVYEKEDQRNPLHIKFGMGDDEMVIKYSPEEAKDSIRNSVNVSFFDRTRNDEAFRQERMKDIIETTQGLGISTSIPTCKPGTENSPCQDETKLDFEKLKQTK